MSNDSSEAEVTTASRNKFRWFARRAYEDLGSPAKVILVTIAIFLASQAVIAPVLVGIGHSLFRPHSVLDLDNNVTDQFFFILIAELSAAWLAIKAVQRRGLSLASIGLGRPLKLSDLWRAALGFGVFFGLLIISSLAISQLSPNLTNQQQNLGFNHLTTSLEHSLAFISLVVMPPIGEEILVRGYLFSGLRLRWRFWPAVLATSLFFGAAHLEFGMGAPLVWGAAVDTFLLSVVLCFLRERTGALYAGMVVHMLNNLIAFGVHFK